MAGAENEAERARLLAIATAGVADNSRSPRRSGVLDILDSAVEGTEAAEQHESNPAATFLDNLEQANAITNEGRELAAAAAVAGVETPPEPTETRGVPHPDRRGLRQQWSRAGTERQNVLSELYGADALVLGHLLFTIPPVALRINKTNINYRWKPLRTNETIAVKSGNGECWIEIDLVFVGLDQINRELSGLIALWQRVPFCFVENQHIRNMMIPDRPEDSMALCLDTLVLDVVAGRPDMVQASLITKWFNYKPYSMNFWFRRSWAPASGSRPNAGSNSGSDEASETVPDNAQTGTIVDFEDIQNPANADFSLPPEVRLEYPVRSENPGDPNIAVTTPVVYPFNSEPFMDHIVTGQTRQFTVPQWSDGLRFRWNSFMRVQTPVNWARDFRSGRIAAEPPSQRADGPAPIENNQDVPRNVILFVGDKITGSYLGIESWSADIQEYTGSTFARDENYDYYALVDEHATPNEMIDRVRSNLGNTALTSTSSLDSDNHGDKIAAVVLMGGTYAGMLNQTGLDQALFDLENIVNIILDTGAIIIWVTPPPFYGVTSSDGYVVDAERVWLEALCAAVLANAQANSNDRLIACNSHSILSQIPERFNGNYIEEYQAGVIEEFPTTAGGAALAGYIYRHLPWNSMRAVAGAPTLFTVNSVTDGDTFVAQRGGEEEIRVRLAYVDTLETYEADGYPDGQDTGREPEVRWGELATEALTERIGGQEVSIEFTGEENRGRQIGVVSLGEENINQWLILQGYGFSFILKSADPDVASPYINAGVTAVNAGLRIHRNDQPGGKPDVPSRWRQAHPPI